MEMTRGPGAQVMASIRAAVASVDRAIPIFDVQSLDDRISAAISCRRFNASLAGGFAAAALLLAQ
jgi:hypothetical protein